MILEISKVSMLGLRRYNANRKSTQLVPYNNKYLSSLTSRDVERAWLSLRDNTIRLEIL
jgi:hypothetical protein